MVSCAGFDRQYRFARRALDLLPDDEEAVFEATHRGLLMSGLTEADFVRPSALLREMFGTALRFSAPRVRLNYDAGWQQPIMGFRVAVTVSGMAPVRRSLEMRGAAIHDIEVRPETAVIRGEAALIDLIGYPRALGRLSRDSAHAIFWLSHYVPLWSYVTETMACHAD